MNIGSLGYNYSHDSNFVMERPDGTGCYLMLLIKEPSLFVINGKEIEVKKNSFVTFTPETPYSYRGDKGAYADDWIYFTLDEDGKERFSQLSIPFNEVIYLGRMEALSRLVHIIACEFYSADINRGEIVRHYTEIFLLKLSGLIQLNSALLSQPLADKNQRMTHLRSIMFSYPETIADVGTMANDMGMSRSGFQHLYKRIFGVSVMQDITAARISYAKHLLSDTGLGVKAIAEKCGYASEYSFMRRFRELTGRTPTEYRSIK